MSSDPINNNDDHSSSSSSSSFFYPLEARVILHGLVNAPELNGKIGIVRSSLNNNTGRYSVYIEDDNKIVGLKPSNLQYEPRIVQSLSVKELKMILRNNDKVKDSDISGVDKSELQAMVHKMVKESDNKEEVEIAALLAKAKAPKSSSTIPNNSSRYNTGSATTDPTQAAEQLQNMNPDQLRQQAQMMRTMDPNQVRRMNPQLANMTDEQIKMAADQMEMMANNPHMMKMAADQMRNMDPADVQKMQRQMQNGTVPNPTNVSMGGGNSSNNMTQSHPSTGQASNANSANASTATPTPQQAQQAANMMANMTPEQLKQQAEMLKNMDPDTVRRMNPQLAHMTDDQINMAATQFEMMASNPDMMTMAMNQMKNMTPEQLEAMKNNSTPGTMPNMPPDMSQMGGDPAKMLASMDKTQLKQMLQSIKDNPEMLKQFAAMTGVSEEQLKQGVEAFAGMSDAKMDAALKMMQSVQKAKDTWKQVDAKAGGQLAKILIAFGILLVGLIIYYFFFREGGLPSAAKMDADFSKDAGETAENVVDEDEFGSEF